MSRRTEKQMRRAAFKAFQVVGGYNRRDAAKMVANCDGAFRQTLRGLASTASMQASRNAPRLRNMTLARA